MIRKAWRLVKDKHAANAFDGEGAWLFGGRWNSRGTRVVYASATQSLAALETLVHLNPPVLFQFVVIPIEFDERLIEVVHDLPAGWRDEPPGPASQRVGDKWAKENRSVVLEFPSAIVPGESNYLLNPLHPNFAKVNLGKPQAFSFDPRLL